MKKTVLLLVIILCVPVLVFAQHPAVDKGMNLIVQPSFNLLTEGTDVCTGTLLSPIISSIDNFDAFVVDSKEKKILEFGKVKELRTE